MKNMMIAVTGILVSSLAWAEKVEGIDELICAAGQAQICFETRECFSAARSELSTPNFVIVGAKNKTASSTRASGQNRTSLFSSVERNDGMIYLQGVEGERIHSFIINESSGYITFAIARDGLSVTAFGVCTDVDV